MILKGKDAVRFHRLIEDRKGKVASKAELKVVRNNPLTRLFNKTNPCYVVCYRKGVYEDCTVIPHFVTKDLKRAQSWCSRYDALIKKWKEYYEELVLTNIEDEDYTQHIYGRKFKIGDYGHSSYKVLDFR